MAEQKSHSSLGRESTSRRAGTEPRSADSAPNQNEMGSEAGSRLAQLELKESELWRAAIGLLILLVAGFAVLSWDTLRHLSFRLEALLIGVVLLIVLLAVFVWQKSKQVAELRGLVRGLERPGGKPVSSEQFEQLLDIVSRSQQGYRDLIDTFDDLLFLLSSKGEILAANRSVVELLEAPFSELIGHRIDEFLEVVSGEVSQGAWAQLVDRGHWTGILRVKMKKSGVVRQFDCVLRAMIKDGQVVGASGLARDITRLRESEALFTELFETLRAGVYFTTPDGKLLDANPALVRMLGYESKEELLGVNVHSLFLDPSQRSAELLALERNGAIEDCEIVLRRKDGSQIICLDSSTAIRDSSGEIVRYQGTLDDITQRREMEKRLHQEQEFARRLVESFPDLIVVLDVEGRYTYVSPRIKEALGFEPQELIGKKVGERTNPDDRPAMLEMFNHLLKGTRTFGMVEYRPQHKQGGWRIFRATASPLYDTGGQIAGVIASSRDVTNLKRMEQQLIQSEKLAAMGQMIAGVAHELNNPLTAILGVSELLRERAPEDATQRQLDLVHRQAKRAASIVQSLLAFSRPAAPREAPINLLELVRRTLQLHEHSLRSNRINVEIQPAAGDASGETLPSVLGDANQLMQVFLNLITNAEQAIRDVRDHGTIRIRCGGEGDRVSVVVQDDGSGIPKGALPRIFDPFYTTKRPGRGTGLGLSICMAIVREHGGNIEVQAAPGGGSIFTVTLPGGGRVENEAHLQFPPGAAREGGMGNDLISLQGRRALIVDDEESIRDLVQDGLSCRGIIVDCAADPRQALELAAQRQYDAILCDLNLPSSPGPEFIIELQRINQPGFGKPAPALILMTGDLLNSNKIESLTQGGMRVLEKPFQISELVAALREAIGVASIAPMGSARK